MSTELLEDLRQAYPHDLVDLPDPEEVWGHGRRARRRRHVGQSLVAAAAIVIVSAGVLQVARPGGVAVTNDPVGTVQQLGGWDLLPPGSFTYDEVAAALTGWDTVVDLGPVDDAVFDVGGDGTVAVFLPASGEIVVQTATGDRIRIDAGFVLEAFPPQRSVHHLRIGPDRRLYLTSLDGEASRDRHRLTVLDEHGELVGTRVTVDSHHPAQFHDGQVWLRTDDGWAAVATIGGPLAVEGPVTTPTIPTVTWIEDQGSILHQITGGPSLGERYTLAQDGRELSWTGPTDGVLGWASGAIHEDRPPAVLVQHEARPPLILLPTLDGLLAAWADPHATGLTGVGDSRAVAVDGPAGPVLYWLQDTGGDLAVVRASP